MTEAQPNASQAQTQATTETTPNGKSKKLEKRVELVLDQLDRLTHETASKAQVDRIEDILIARLELAVKALRYKLEPAPRNSVSL